MYAVPLTARGRGVAVLYADHGATGGKVNLEALETLVRVAGLTVELLAAAHMRVPRAARKATADFEQAHHEGIEEAAPSYPEPVAAEYEHQASDFSFGEEPAESSFEATPVEATPEFAEEPAVEEPVAEEPTLSPWPNSMAANPPRSKPKSFVRSPSAEEESEGGLVFDSGAAHRGIVGEPVPSPFRDDRPG